MELKVIRVGNDGEGIAYHQNKPVFIYYAYKNETVRADLSINKRGAYEGELKEIIKPSEYRITPQCPFYGICGGCNLMHIRYQESLYYKKDLMKYLIKKEFGDQDKDILINNTIPSKNIFNYRNQMNIPVRKINNENSIGLFYRGTNQFLPIDQCMIQDDHLNKLAKDILWLMNKKKIEAYDPKTNTGQVVNLAIRTNLEGQMQLTFVLKNQANLTNLIKELLKKNPKVISVYENFVPKYKTNRDLLSGTLKHLAGTEELIMTLENYQFFLTPHAFFQLNTKQAINLYNTIIKKADLKKTDIVLDAYSGVGTIATFLSPHVKEVVAIESIKDAVKAMEKSNQVNQIQNIKPITGDVIKVTEYLKKKFDVMVFDPPRTGLGEKVVNYILKNKPSKIIYVSCDPETLVKDLKGLSKLYQIVSIDPFDMFPQTSQVESITLLSLKTA